MDIVFRKQLLLQKYLNNECTREEAEELFRYLQEDKDEDWYSVTEDLWTKVGSDRVLSDERVDEILQRVTDAAQEAEVVPIRRRQWYWVAAAGVAIVIGLASVYMLRSREVAPGIAHIDQQDTAKQVQAILPGGTKAVLQAEGEYVELGRADTSFVLAGNTVSIGGGNVGIEHKKPVQYTLTAPRGGEYNLTLADGTRVWLNADSKISYPSVFAKTVREVTLSGEAYFEVNHEEDRPFIVHTRRQDVQVLGTEFNVQAYNNEEEQVTTLVNGKVRINSPQKEIVLKRGQQAITGDEGQTRIKQDADIHQVLAWKEGYFRFDNTGIHEIMRQLARWYDIDVSFGKEVPDKEFVAIISRDNDISKVLEMMEGTGEIRFSIDGRKVTVLRAAPEPE